MQTDKSTLPGPYYFQEGEFCSFTTRGANKANNYFWTFSVTGIAQEIATEHFSCPQANQIKLSNQGHYLMPYFSQSSLYPGISKIRR